MSSLLAANTVDAAALADELARYRVIDPQRVVDLLSEFSGGGPAALAEYLIGRGVLTAFQADRALAGDARSLALGPYRLTGVAGPGILGTMYAATRRDKPGVFHVRVLPLRSLWKARQAKQFIRSFASVRHPFVVPLTDADSANGFHYLVWPRVEGEPLTERVGTGGPLAPNDITVLLARLAEALHACHVRKLVHGALTPRSIALDGNGRPHLVDLGAGALLGANLADDESLLDTLSAATATTEILRFAAPEFVESLGGTPATDQYALGAIGCYCLTGESPFAAASLTDWFTARFSGPPRELSGATDLPAELVAVLERMLRPNPEERFSGLDEVQERLEAISGPSNTVPLQDGMTETDEQSPLGSEQSRSSSSGAWPLPSASIADFPTRDDSDASITFELPPPGADEVPGWVATRTGQAGLAAQTKAGSDEVNGAPPGTPVSFVQNSGLITDSLVCRDAASLARALETPVSDPPPAVEEPTDEVPEKLADEVDAEEFPSDVPTKPPTGFLAKAYLEPQPRSAVPPPTARYQAGLAGASVPAPMTGSALHSALGATPPGPEPHDPPGNTDSGSKLHPSIGGTVPKASSDSMLWNKVKRSLLFWQAPQAQLRVSVYGPVSVTPGQSAKISVYVHTADTEDSVKTLSRAFQQDAQLIGSGSVAQEIPKEAELGVHLSVPNMGVAKSLLSIVWRGQPHRLVFEVQVPHDRAIGPAVGVISVGRDNVRIGKIDIRLSVRLRKG
jgi:serine/threonine protein kinase